MHDIYKLKDMLCEELKEYGRKGELSAGSLDIVDKLAHAVKNLDKIIEAYDEDGYSSDGMSYARRYDTMDGRGGSYARERGARRDSMGRYSRADEHEHMMMELHEAMEMARDATTKSEIKRLIDKLDRM